ncbi:hypothetical protein [Butyrivibrio sp. JL13D10]|uniref:hypothetical protein n=1 Tax=Butyrivibrio sp. JL13D10 TaxID=3236815 RepID=UPI0038B4AEC0
MAKGSRTKRKFVSATIGRVTQGSRAKRKFVSATIGRVAQGSRTKQDKYYFNARNTT